MSNIEALRAALAAGRWYVLAATGTALLCVDEEDARHEAAECDRMFPTHGPHRAVQLVPAAPDLLAELDRLKAERDALRAAGGQLANVAFNWAQEANDTGRTLTTEQRDLLKRLQEQWDAALKEQS